MVEHTQTIRRQIADELSECVWPFCEIGAKKINPVTQNASKNWHLKKAKYVTLNGHISKTWTNLESRLRFSESSFSFP